jgi:hypothetical protein
MNTPIPKCVISLVSMFTGVKIECYSTRSDLSSRYTASRCIFVNRDLPRLLVAILQACQSKGTDSLMICLRSKSELREDIASQFEQVSHLLKHNGIVALLVSQGNNSAIKSLPGYMQLLTPETLSIFLMAVGVKSLLPRLRDLRDGVESGGNTIVLALNEAQEEAGEILHQLRFPVKG